MMIRKSWRSFYRQYCKKVEQSFLDEINRKKPKTLDAVSRIWYGGESRSSQHYDNSRYHCLNVHSVFQKGTIEFRLFNSTTHAGKIKAYIQLCLAISAQALNKELTSEKNNLLYGRGPSPKKKMGLCLFCVQQCLDGCRNYLKIPLVTQLNHVNDVFFFLSAC